MDVPLTVSLASSAPSVDAARQAIHAIRGYQYQALAAALAWVDLENDAVIFLEVAEDYAEIVGSAINAVQVKDHPSSGSVTLHSISVRKAVAAFVDLVERNPSRQVRLRFLTTSSIGTERPLPAGFDSIPGLEYWRLARSVADVEPLRQVLEGDRYPDSVRKFCSVRNDGELREELIRPLTWDCGSPDVKSLRQELESRLVIVLRDRFQMPSQEAPRVADAVAYRVIQKSAHPETQDRALTQEKFNELVDYATRVSLPRATFEQLIRKLAERAQPSAGHTSSVESTSRDNQYWLIDASTFPQPNILVRRTEVEAAIQYSLKTASVCFVVGPTGVGKSMAAYSIASKPPNETAWIIDLRNADIREVQIRLNQTLPLLAGMEYSTLIVEDLDGIEDSSVQTALARVVEAAHRHDMRVLVTRHRWPSAGALNRLGQTPDCVVACPHFTEQETNALVEKAGGDPAVWGRLAHFAGASGHPQLTHAFVAGMAAKGWSNEEAKQVVSPGRTSDGLESARDAARENLIRSLPAPAPHLLYRLSIATGTFKRSLAIAIGTVSPPVPGASECFDQLVGRWIEALPAGRFRTSPLAVGYGSRMLTTEEQIQVHQTIATEILRDTPIDIGDFDAILLHGIAGQSNNALFILSHIINTADLETREAIAKRVIAFPFLDTKKPIYPKNRTISAMLRLSQFRLVVESDAPEDTAEVVSALLYEARGVPAKQAGQHLEPVVLSAILSSIGIANHVPEWVDLLSRYRRLLQKDEILQSAKDDADKEVPILTTLFSIGIHGLDSVEKLENIFRGLDALGFDERQEMLTPIEPRYADFDLVVHHPWTSESRRTGFDAASAAKRYKRMARLAQEWGNRKLSLQCSVGVVAMLDEHLGETEAALGVLNAAQQSLGKDPILTRAFAKFHDRHGQNPEALGYYRDIVPHVDAISSVNAVYTLREAAIVAARCGDWETARSWFLKAQAAAEPLEPLGLGAIRVGFGADAAMASYEVGDLQGALSLLQGALLSLEEIDPHANLQAAHCHHVVRHTVLWLDAKSQGRDTTVEGEPIAMIPGACSNPEPVEGIKERPLGHIDLAWYLLAGMEITADVDLGIRGVLTERTALGHFPVLEHGLRLDALCACIRRLDSASFSICLLEFVAAEVFFQGNDPEPRELFDVMDPTRELIPEIPRDSTANPAADRVARRAILAFAVRSLFDGQPNAVARLHDVMELNLGQSYPGKTLVDNWTDPLPVRSDLDYEIAAILPQCLAVGALPPDLLFLAGLRLLEWIAQSQFKVVLMPQFAPWLKGQWKRVLKTQRFLLHAPASSASSHRSRSKKPVGRRAVRCEAHSGRRARSPLASKHLHSQSPDRAGQRASRLTAVSMLRIGVDLYRDIVRPRSDWHAEPERAGESKRGTPFWEGVGVLSGTLRSPRTGVSDLRRGTRAGPAARVLWVVSGGGWAGGFLVGLKVGCRPRTRTNPTSRIPLNWCSGWYARDSLVEIQGRLPP